jgi:hypothetical protein
MSNLEIMVGIGRSDRGAIDQLLARMFLAGAIVREGRGRYALVTSRDHGPSQSDRSRTNVPR